MSVGTKPQLGDVAVALDRDVFLRSLIRELVGSLESVVGLEDAAGYISVVGLAIGDNLNREYRRALDVSELDREQVAAVLVDLKRRIQGSFYIIEQTETEIVLGNTACPFGDKVIGRPSLCMMTSNVFGHIAAQNLGYAKVSLDETIARGDRGCRVVVRLQPSDDHEGREYFSAGIR